MNNNYFVEFTPAEIDYSKITPTLDTGYFNVPGWNNSFYYRVPTSSTTSISSGVINNNSESSTNTDVSKRQITVNGNKSLESMSFDDIIKELGLPIKITSSFRPGAKTVQGRTSHHSRKDSYGNPMAYDFRPTNGDIEGLLTSLYSNQRFLDWMDAHGFGIIEETTPDVMKRTGAKKPLLHLGPDSLAKQHSNKRRGTVAKAQQGQKIEVPFSVFEASDPQSENLPPIFEDITGEKSDLSSWSAGLSQDGTPIVKPSLVTNNNGQSPAIQMSSQNTTSQVSGSSQKSSGSSNSSIIINTLMDRLKLTREQAAGIMGVIQVESGGLPNNYNKREKAGTYKGSKANGAGYGAGILQWSMGRKQEALKLIGKTGTSIENLPLEDQIEIIARELEGPYKHTLNGLRQCKTAGEAAATMYCHNVAGISSSDLPATQAEIDKINRRYAKLGASSIVNKGMDYAEQFAR